MEFLIIEKALQGYRIKDTITDQQRYYIGYSLKAAEKAHRAQFNLRYKHLEKIYI